jgi:hypothetical protein
MRTSPAAGVLAAALAAASANSEEISYAGWKGSVQYENKEFLACTLVSPVADGSFQLSVWQDHFGIAYYTDAFRNPPRPGEKSIVKLGLVGGENAPSDWTSTHGYEFWTLANLVTPNAGTVVLVEVKATTSDEIVSALKEAAYLKVFGAQVTWTLNLRHQSASNSTTKDSNDTYGALQEVIACANRHLALSAGPNSVETKSTPKSLLPPALSQMPPFLDPSPPFTRMPSWSAGERDCPGGGCAGRGPIHSEH